MLKKIIATIALIAVTSTATYTYTMSHLTIETDGDGDSAFVSCMGQEWFYGINGHSIDLDGDTNERL